MRTRRLTAPAVLALASLAAALVACGGDESPTASGSSGVTTRTPAPAASTPVATEGPRATATTAAPLRTPDAPPTAEPDDIARALAALGTGEDARTVAGAFALVEPRCEEPREELGDLVERGWRILNEQRGMAVPVSALLTRMWLAFPPGSAQFSCNSVIGAVITELSP